MADVVITRKVKLNIDAPKERLKDIYAQIFGWQRLVHRAANWVVTHHHMQESLKDMFYLTDEAKKKLANIEKDADGILTTSKQNTTYQLLSKKYKGECPMGIMNALNSLVVQTYQKNKKDIMSGEKSLPTYRKNMPIPICASNMINWRQEPEYGNFHFTLYGIDFKTFFGRDLSRNREIFEMAINQGKYKLCDSSIQIERDADTKKWCFYLLAVFSFDREVVKVDPNKVAVCNLSIKYPIIINEKGNKIYSIGTAEEYLHRRIAIQGALSRIKASSKYNKGGHGRERKMQATERFEKLEYNYVNSKMHLYSKMLIDYCLKHGIGKIILDNYSAVVDETHQQTEESKFLLASWSHFSLAEKIKYKANKYGIVVEKTGVEKESGTIVAE